MDLHPLLLGHRGARGDKSAAENTLAAFDLALASGCDGFEFDVRLTADGQAVICHDPRSNDLEIARTSAQQLKLPLLREVLERYHQSAFLDIELKVPGLEAITLNLLRQFRTARGFVVSSFLPEVLKSLCITDATTPLGIICETPSQLNRWEELPVEYVIAHHSLLAAENIQKIKIAGRKLFVWTVNSEQEMKRFSRQGVDGLISDQPRLLANTLGSD
jgi:glycerophosphoryl diester phosphodiesterase